MVSAYTKDFLWRLAIVLAVVAMLAALFYPYEGKAEGTTAHVSWILPTCYNDGNPPTPPATGCGTQSPFPASDILSVTVKWTGTLAGQLTLTGAATQTDVPIPCGGVAFTVSVTPKSTAKFLAQGADSSPATYATGVSCRPNPPTAVTAN